MTSGLLTSFPEAAPSELPTGRTCAASRHGTWSFLLQNQCSGDGVCAQTPPWSSSSSNKTIQKQINQESPHTQPEHHACGLTH
jgi:hypothetical protein